MESRLSKAVWPLLGPRGVALLSFYSTILSKAILLKGISKLGYGEMGNFMYCWWEYRRMQTIWKMVSHFLKWLESPYDPAILPLHVYPREMMTYAHTKTCTYSSIIQNSQKAKTIQLSISGWMNKQNIVQWNIIGPWKGMKYCYMLWLGWTLKIC